MERFLFLVVWGGLEELFLLCMFLCVYARENEMRVVGCRHVKFRGVDGKEGEFEFEILYFLHNL